MAYFRSYILTVNQRLFCGDSLAKPLIAITFLAIVYFASAKLGLALAFVHPSATAVWPPTGIALAALILFGYQVWPGVALGAFLANITNAGSVSIALGIAAGNTLEAVLGAYLVQRFAGGRRAFDRPQDVLKFAALAGLASTAVSATIGATTLYTGGLIGISDYQQVWFTWWLGDMGGALIVAPVLISWSAHSRLTEDEQKLSEFLLAFVLLAAVGYLAFASFPAHTLSTASIAFLTIPILLWMAIRLGRGEQSAAVLLISAIAVWGTLRGYGPFFRVDRNESLLLLQEFGGMIAVMILMVGAATSNRNRTERALRDSEAMARRLLELHHTTMTNMGEGTYTVDKHGLTTYMNPEAARLFGFKPEELLGRRMHDLTHYKHPDGSPFPIEECAGFQVLHEGKILRNFEDIFIRKDGSFFPVSYSSSPLRNPDGEIVGLVIVFQDITERKRTEVTLQTRVRQQQAVAALGELALRERDLQLVFDRAMATLAETLKVEYCKVLELLPEGAELLLRAGVGWREGLIGKATVGAGRDSQAGYTLFSNAPVVVWDLRKDERFSGPPLLLDHGVICGMSAIIRGMGEVPWGVLGIHSTRQIQFSSDDVNFLVAVANVLSNAIQRKKDEAALHESEERFRSLVSVITDVLWVTDASGAFIAPQRAWETYTGQAWEEHAGFGWANALHPDDRQRVKEIWRRACESRTLYQSEGRLWHAPTRQWRHFMAKATPLLNPDGSVREWVGTCTDIDDQKRAEEQLENTVAERTRDLVTANARLLHDVEERRKLEEQLLQAQKMESIGTLAGGIAHDFNNILNIIQGYATILREPGVRDDQISESLAVICETVQRGSTLTQQLLTLARKSSTQLAPVDTKALLEELIALLSQTFPKAIELTSDLERNLPTIVADKNQLAQALLNLCLNARDAMPAGGKLVLQTSLVDGAGMSERFQAAQQDGYICIRLTDTGCGMDEPTRSRIFEPFFTTKPKGQGTGLGLSVVYGIVRNHAGFIDVESAPNEGTTFHIYLPIRQGEVQSGGLMRTIAEKTSDGLPAARRGTVLFVDDEENQVRLMQGFLERNGYSVLIARDGAEAIEVHQRHKDEIALVILDLGLPKLNGWQAFQRMRQLQPDLGALFATGFLSPEAEAEMHKGQPVTIIQKPYDLDELLAKISAVIRSEHANSNAPVIRQDVYRQP